MIGDDTHNFAAPIDFLCTKCGKAFTAIPSPHDPCPRCGYTACRVPAIIRDAREIPWSSIVGSGVTLHDASGRVVAQIAFRLVDQKQAHKLALQFVTIIKAAGIEI